jgi:hypothetical protein
LIQFLGYLRCLSGPLDTINPQMASTGAHGVAFEELVGKALKLLRGHVETDGWTCLIRHENEIRAFYKEPSLNGVDHQVLLEDASGIQHMILIQEKWKLVTNQREVSQFLDCCARILARMPDYKGTIHRIWVSRTVPSQNGEKSLAEGQAILVQCCTSQNMLAFTLILTVCEILERRDLAEKILGKMGSLLPSKEDGVLEDVDPGPTQATFQPVSDFGEKRVLPITKQTVVRVLKGE